MRNVAYFLVFAALFGGCRSIPKHKDIAQKKFKEQPYLLEFSGFSELTIKSPTVKTYDTEGNIVREEPVRDEKGRVLLASWKVKDQTITQPKGPWDFGGALVRAGLAYGLGMEAFGVIETAVKHVPQSPEIVRVTDAGADTVVTPNPSGSFKIERFE